MGLFGFGKKRFNYNCPVCQREYWADFNPLDLTEFDRFGFAELSETTCGFCKTKTWLYFDKNNRSVVAKDAAWEEYEKEFWDKHSDAEELVDNLTDIIEELETEGKSASKEKVSLQKAEAQLKKMAEQFDKKEAAYSDKQNRWIEKYDRTHS